MRQSAGFMEEKRNVSNQNSSSLPHTGYEVRQRVGANSEIFLLFSVIKRSCLFRDCTSKYLEITLKYLPEEAVYSLYTPSLSQEGKVSNAEANWT